MRTSLFALMIHIVSQDAKRKKTLLLDTGFHVLAQKWSLLLRMFLKKKGRTVRSVNADSDDSLHPDGWGDFVFYADGINWVQGVDMLVYPP